MLLSRRHKFIFIHVHKVGGQSLTNALMPYAAVPWQRALNCLIGYRYQLKIYTKLKQYSKDRLAFEPQPFNDHIRGPELCERLGEEDFKQFFSFAFVRNPWAWVLSNYAYARSNPRHWQHKHVSSFKNFEDFCVWQYESVKNPALQYDYVFNKQGQQVLDFVGRQETIEKDFERICQKLGINASLPRYNVSTAGGYRGKYSDRARSLIAEQFAQDIDAFGYTF
jgi:hypothetical protein